MLKKLLRHRSIKEKDIHYKSLNVKHDFFEDGQCILERSFTVKEKGNKHRIEKNEELRNTRKNDKNDIHNDCLYDYRTAHKYHESLCLNKYEECECPSILEKLLNYRRFAFCEKTFEERIGFRQCIEEYTRQNMIKTYFRN